MAKQQQPVKKPIQATKASTLVSKEPKYIPPPPQIPIPGTKYHLSDFKPQAIILSVLALIFYFNSFFNEFAHDDGIVIVKNEYVLEGFAGIGKILTSDAYDSYYRQLNTTNQLNGGRYRPLSIVTFAIEQQFMGAIPLDKIDSILKQNIAYGVRGEQLKKLNNQMHVRHVFNVLWYIGSLIILLWFLRFIVFRSEPIMAFIAALIFTIHPIHTEVVANVKSRDEIMSLLFMCLTFILDFKYREENKTWMLLAAMGSFFLAFLSKEYAITMVILLPMAWYLFRNYSIGKSIFSIWPYVVVFGLYYLIRHSIVAPPGDNSDSEVLNNPYFFASPSEKLATEIATSLNYLKLLIFPHPLSADYSYNSIPYKDFSHPLVWLSLVVHAGLIVTMVLTFLRKNVLSFAIAFYLLHLMLICNIIFDIGATMGERLIYHSSVGFAIAVAYLLYKGALRLEPKVRGRAILTGFLSLVTILAAAKTITRNADWKNDDTLFSADIKTVPNSVLVCANVAAADITAADAQPDEKSRTEMLHQAIALLDHALSIHHTMVASFMNRGIAYYKLGDMDKAKANLDTVKMYYPTYPTLPGIYKLIGDDYVKKGWEKYGRVGDYAGAIETFKKGLAIDSTNPDLWYNLGGAYYSNKQYQEAVQAWQITLRLKPDYVKARRGLEAVMGAAQNPAARQQPQQGNPANQPGNPAKPQ